MVLLCQNIISKSGIRQGDRFDQRMAEEAGIGTHVDALYNTHPHRDHLSGLFEMLEAGYTFGKIYTAFPHDFQDGTVTVVQQKMIQAAEENGIPVADVKTGDVIPFGEAEITVICDVTNPLLGENGA